MSVASAEAAPVVPAIPVGAQNLQPRPENCKSFDMNAWVRMSRYDLTNFGRVLPETYGQIRDETLSWFVEGVERAACTTFVYKRDGDDLVIERNGQRFSCLKVMEEGKRVADAEAKTDSRRQFLADEATDHLHAMHKILKLKPGEQHVYVSTYRKDLEKLYSKAFMQECGRFPDREMGFIYQAYCTDNGDIIFKSQTVDRSNAQAFKAVLECAAQNPTVPMFGLVEAYDQSLTRQLKGRFHAGRRPSEIQETKNAWLDMLAQTDLIDYFMTRLQEIARSPLGGQALEQAVKKHVYGVAAAFKKRLDGEMFTPAPASAKATQATMGVSVARHVMVEQEVFVAYRQFVLEGRPIVGCGGALKMLEGEEAIMNASPSEVLSAIFGPKQSKEEDAGDGLGPIDFQCLGGHWNKRIYGRSDTPCRFGWCDGGVCGPTEVAADTVKQEPDELFVQYLKEAFSRGPGRTTNSGPGRATTGATSSGPANRPSKEKVRP